MANSALEGKSMQVSDSIVKTIEKALQNNKSSPGAQRAKNIVNHPQLTYYNAKRIKNFLENTDNSSIEYQLAGGDQMKKAIDLWLNEKRISANKGKDLRTSLGNENQHKKPYKRNSFKVGLPIAAPKADTLIENKVTILVTEKQINYLKHGKN